MKSPGRRPSSLANGFLRYGLLATAAAFGGTRLFAQTPALVRLARRIARRARSSPADRGRAGESNLSAPVMGTWTK